MSRCRAFCSMAMGTLLMVPAKSTDVHQIVTVEKDLFPVIQTSSSFETEAHFRFKKLILTCIIGFPRLLLLLEFFPRGLPLLLVQHLIFFILEETLMFVVFVNEVLLLQQFAQKHVFRYERYRSFPGIRFKSKQGGPVCTILYSEMALDAQKKELEAIKNCAS